MNKKLSTMLLLMATTTGMAQVRSKKITPEEAVVTLEFQGVKTDSIYVHVPSLHAPEQYFKPNQAGIFRLQLKPPFPKMITIGGSQPKWWNTEVFVERGSRLNIVRKKDGNLFFSGKDALQAEILYKAINRYDAIKNGTDFTKIPPEELLKKATAAGDANRQLLTENKTKLSPDFYRSQRIDFDFRMLTEQMNVPLILYILGKRDYMASIPDGYWELDKNIRLHDSLLTSDVFKEWITAVYLNYLREKQYMNNSTDQHQDKGKKRIEIELDLAEKHFTGKIRSMVMAYSLCGMITESKKVEETKPWVDKYILSFATEEDKTKVLEYYDRYAKTNVGKVTPTISLKNIDGKEVSLQDFKGKVVYMDFWASWCAPCRDEMKNGSPKLHAKFKDNKDVVFLFISLDESKDAWKKALDADKVEGIHMLATGGYNHPVAKAFNVGGLPHYIIIGKDGKIFDNHAPRPSNDEAANRIHEALQLK